MPEATLTFRFPGPRSYRGIAKMVLVVACGVLLGYGMILDDQAAMERSVNLTYDEYVEGFDAYVEDLTAAVLPPGANIVAGVAGLGVMASLYEILAMALAWVIRGILRRVRPGHGPPTLETETGTWSGTS